MIGLVGQCNSCSTMDPHEVYLFQIIDKKSLIKKYQREISVLKEELDKLRQGMLVGVNHEELLISRQQLEEGQVKMQSRLEEEEEAKAALMSRIRRLTKLILVSTKNTILRCLSDVPSHQMSHSVGEEDKLDVRGDGTLLIDSDNQKDSPFSIAALASDPSYEFKHRISSNRRNDELSPTITTVTESTQAGELISGTKLLAGGMTSDQMDLLVEQVKMLAGEITFSTSTLKRLVDQSVNDPDSSKTQVLRLCMDCTLLKPFLLLAKFVQRSLGQPLFKVKVKAKASIPFQEPYINGYLVHDEHIFMT